MRKNSLGREILYMVAAGGLVTAGIILSGPNVMRLMKALGRDTDRYSRQRVQEALRQLERKRIIQLQSQGYESHIKLTPAGKRIILKYKVDDLTFPTSQSWDGKWRMVLFDVPESLKKARTALSCTLHRAGAFQFQKSVFVYPHDCADDVRFVTELFGVQPFVKYAVLDHLDGEAVLKNHFQIYQSKK